MTRIMLDADLLRRLGGLREPVELVDGSGEVRATVSPREQNGRWEPPLTAAERRPPAEWQTVPAEEVLAKLRAG